MMAGEICFERWISFKDGELELHAVECCNWYLLTWVVIAASEYWPSTVLLCNVRDTTVK